MDGNGDGNDSSSKNTKPTLKELRERVQRHYSGLQFSQQKNEIFSPNNTKPKNNFPKIVDEINDYLNYLDRFINGLLRQNASMKEEIVRHRDNKQQYDEEVVNWSYVLKYLLSTNSRLRRELRQEQGAYFKLERKVRGMNVLCGGMFYECEYV